MVLHVSRAFPRAILVAVLALAVSLTASAEPYLAAYKGMQCSACHSHPAGGGLRNTYGNAFAQTELPADRLGNSDAAFWTGAVLDWLSVGGDLRAEYRYVDTPNQEEVSEFDIVRGTIYLEAQIIPGRLSVYIDQQVAPSSSVNREAYIRINSANKKWSVTAGQFFLPYGLRLQDDSAFVRQATGISFNNPDRGIQVGYESGPWSTQLSVSNGSGGGSESDTGKQISLNTAFVRNRWRIGVSLNSNDTDFGDRRMVGAYATLRTGDIVWLGEVDLITDDPSGGIEQDATATLLEGNWLFRKGHNLKVSYDYLDPNDDVSEDHQVRYSLVWEFTPMQFLQSRIGARVYDGIPQSNAQNRDEFFAELHGFF